MKNNRLTETIGYANGLNETPRVAGHLSVLLGFIQLPWGAVVGGLLTAVFSPRDHVNPSFIQSVFILAVCALPVPFAFWCSIFAIVKSATGGPKIFGGLGLTLSLGWILLFVFWASQL
jgi:hypothetical protein